MPLKAINNQHVLNYSGFMVTLIVGVLSAYTVRGSASSVLVIGFSVAVLVCFTIYLSLSVRPRKVLLTLFWTEAFCIGSLFFLVPSSFVAVISIVWLVQAGDLFAPRTHYALLFACLGTLSAAQIFHHGTDNWIEVGSSLALYGLLQLFAISAVQLLIRERHQREETARLNQELIATRELLSQSAAQSERVRIARDLHDILGHYMTALILNLEVASHGAEGKSKDKVEQSLALAKLLLGELRTTVSEMRDDVGGGLEESIRKLVADIPLSIELEFGDAPGIENVEIAEALLRCTQEAITNVIRHSNASACRISLSSEDGLYRLQVSDNGNTGEDVIEGNGLKGMRERLHSLGGELSWSRDDKGFHLLAELKPEPKLGARTQ